MVARSAAAGSISTLLLSSCFLAAFVSYYENFHGLLSPCGITPLSQERVLPWLPSLSQSSLCHLISFVGIAFASLSVTHAPGRRLYIPVLTAMYSFLMVQSTKDRVVPFYNFQRDSLLLEAGFAMSIHGIVATPASSVIPRALMFKLMFMSALVKIQANCPTWLHLTALEFHYVTQPLPSPFAWHALNYLPPLLQRTSVAATLIIELIAPFLLLSPFYVPRRFGCHVQIFLQVLIALTGSYCFFNLLTIALAFACADPSQASDIPGIDKSFLNIPLLFISVASLLAFVPVMFSPGIFMPTDEVSLKFMWNAAKADVFADSIIPIVVSGLVSYTALMSLKDIAVTKRRRRMKLILLSPLPALTIIIILFPLFSLTKTLESDHLHNPDPPFSTKLSQKLYGVVSPYFLSNGYGLFRRMTGVGYQEQEPYLDQLDKWGSGGLPPSIVARPEIVLEGLFPAFDRDESSDGWRELKFRFKPGPLSKAPTFAAPYQPRLDWQMWFAALGSYQHNAWLISLLQKLLNGSTSVISLLEETPESLSEMSAIRAVIYDYDFTRSRSTWSERIPGVTFAEGEEVAQWWSRRNMREYTPALEKDNESVIQFLQQFNLHETCVNESDVAVTSLDIWLLNVRVSLHCDCTHLKENANT